MQRKGLLALVAPTTRRKDLSSMKFAPMDIIADDPNLLASVRELYSRRPETRDLDPWELQHDLYSLGYTDSLVPEAEIAAAIEVARGDYDPEGAAA
jgi:hypothetical protein